MTNFITIAVLICQVGASNKLLCFDKGSENLRQSDVKTSKALVFFKCEDRQYKQCDLETKWDGCKFILLNGTVAFSSYTCPE